MSRPSHWCSASCPPAKSLEHGLILDDRGLSRQSSVPPTRVSRLSLAWIASSLAQVDENGVKYQQCVLPGAWPGGRAISCEILKYHSADFLGPARPTFGVFGSGHQSLHLPTVSGVVMIHFFSSIVFHFFPTEGTFSPYPPIFFPTHSAFFTPKRSQHLAKIPCVHTVVQPRPPTPAHPPGPT